VGHDHGSAVFVLLLVLVLLLEDLWPTEPDGARQRKAVEHEQEHEHEGGNMIVAHTRRQPCEQESAAPAGDMA
jgi:hypothetical protein